MWVIKDKEKEAVEAGVSRRRSYVRREKKEEAMLSLAKGAKIPILHNTVVNRTGQRMAVLAREKTSTHHIIPLALIAAGWLMVMGMLSVCRLL